MAEPDEAFAVTSGDSEEATRALQERSFQIFSQNTMVCRLVIPAFGKLGQEDPSKLKQAWAGGKKPTAHP